MAIENILVIEPDTKWQEMYRKQFERSFPGVQVISVADTESAVAHAQEQQFDLYTTNCPRSSVGGIWTDRGVEDRLLRVRVAALREIHPDAQIALLSARSRNAKPSIEALAQELDIAYFAKQDKDFLQKITAQYGGKSLATFLEAMKTCPDAELQSRLGVHYDWPILLKAGYSRTVSAIRSDTERWVKNPRATTESASGMRDLGKMRVFDYVPGTVAVQVLSWTAAGAMKEEEQQQLEAAGYRTSIWVGHYDSRQPDMPGTSAPRAVVLAIDDIARLVQQKGIPACFPSAKWGSGMLRYEPSASTG